MLAQVLAIRSEEELRVEEGARRTRGPLAHPHDDVRPRVPSRLTNRINLRARYPYRILEQSEIQFVRERAAHWLEMEPGRVAR
jgi:hypothetical protein